MGTPKNGPSCYATATTISQFVIKGKSLYVARNHARQRNSI